MPVAWRLKESIDETLNSPAVKQFLEMMGEMPTPLAPAAKGVAGAGMVINPKNAGKIASTIKNTLLAAGKKVPTDIDIALEYIKAKYPGLASIPNQIVQEPHPRNLNPGSVLYGYAMGGDPVLKGSKEVGTTRRVSVTNDIGQGPERAIETLAHELTHAMRNKRDPIASSTTYVPSKVGYNDYYNQWQEIEARKGGDTGATSFYKFKKALLADKPGLKGEALVDKDFINEVLVPYMSRQKVAMDKGKYTNPYMTNDSLSQGMGATLNQAARTAVGNTGNFRPTDIDDTMLAMGGDEKLRNALVSDYMKKRNLAHIDSDFYSFVNRPSLVDLIMGQSDVLTKAKTAGR